jgi:hypothetical protein
MKRVCHTLAFFVLCSCDNGGVQGREQPETSKALKGRVAPGVAPPSKIRIFRIKNGGTRELVVEAPTAQDATFETRVGNDERRLLLEGVDASDAVIVRGLLDTTGATNDEVLTQPLDAETSIEASVFLELASLGDALVDTTDLRARIDGYIASSVQAAPDRETQIVSLAIAYSAAASARLRAIADSGLSLDASSHFEASLGASTALNAALFQPASGSTDSTYEAFFAALDAVDEALGATALIRAKAEALASFSFVAALRAQGAREDIVSVVERSSAVLQARASSLAVVDLVAKAGGQPTARARASDAAAALRSRVAFANTAQQSRDAFTAFREDLCPSSDVTLGVIGYLLEANPTTGAAIAQAVDAASQARSAYLAALSSIAPEPAAIAEAALSAQRSLRAAVEAQSPTLAHFGFRAPFAIDLVFLAHVSAR